MLKIFEMFMRNPVKQAPELGALARRDFSRLRVGMWVVTAQGEVGIVTKLEDGEAAIDLISAQDGTTYLGIVRTYAEVRQARISEVPECRRNKTALLARGYEL